MSLLLGAFPDSRPGMPDVLIDPRRIEVVATYNAVEDQQVRICTTGGHTVIVNGTVKSVTDQIVELIENA